MYVCMYCRLKGDPNHSLAPSYRTLFENVDKTVDGNGYLNKRCSMYVLYMYVCCKTNSVYNMYVGPYI